jgi:hypothetical protein
MPAGRIHIVYDAVGEISGSHGGKYKDGYVLRLLPSAASACCFYHQVDER